MNRLFGLEGHFAEGEAIAAEQAIVAKSASADHVEQSNMK